MLSSHSFSLLSRSFYANLHYASIRSSFTARVVLFYSSSNIIYIETKDQDGDEKEKKKKSCIETEIVTLEQMKDQP